MNAGSIRHHILLVGIDAYPKVPALYGSVNDVDALETIFLDRLQVRPEAITKLVAPHPHAVRSARVTEDKPTLDNLRRAFETLDSDAVRPGDRVFIHYSGHGTQVFSRVTRAAREALVPVDGAASGNLLFDDELNGFLRRIAARTEDLTILLDCCCSAGATRSALVPKESSIRFCQVHDEFEEASTARTRSFSRAEEGGLLSPFEPSDPGFIVVSSAQSGQSAYEGISPRGVRHGAFTAALLDLLTPMPSDKLADLRWADVWPVLLGRVTAGFSGQNPCLMGRRERRVFGGDFKKGDAGFPVVEERGSYHLQAGTLVGVGVGATVAVYGSEPSFFPTLHSAEDRQARLGLLRVESATASSAIASPVGGPVTLDAGARARLVTSGPADKLVVRLEPFDVKLAKYIEGEAFVRVVSPVDAAEQGAEAMVGWSAQGSWWLGDDVFGEHMPLIQGPMSELRELAAALRHYALYQLPLRLVRRDRLGLGLLRLRILDAQHAQRLRPEEWHDPPLPEVDPDLSRQYRYQLVDRQLVCFSVENRSNQVLYTNVINCAASGRVELLGPTQLEIAPKRRQTFWLRGHLGKPFPCGVSQGREFNVDRVVAVGTASATVDFGCLRVPESFAQAVRSASRDVPTNRGDSIHFWTATKVTVKIVRPAGTS